MRANGVRGSAGDRIVLSRDDLGLVVAAVHLTPVMQRHRDQHLRLVQQRFHPLLGEQPIGERFGQRPAMGVFGVMDRALERIVEKAKRDNAVEGGQTSSQAMRAGRAVLGQRHGAAVTGGGIGKLLGGGFAVEAKVTPAVEAVTARGALAGVAEVEQLSNPGAKRHGDSLSQLACKGPPPLAA